MACKTLLEEEHQLTLCLRKPETHYATEAGMNDKRLTEMTDKDPGANNPKTTHINSDQNTLCTARSNRKKNKNEYPGKVVISTCDASTEKLASAVLNLAIDGTGNDTHTDDNDLEVDAVPLDSVDVEPVDVEPVDAEPVNDVPINEVTVNEVPVGTEPVNEVPINEVTVNEVPVVTEPVDVEQVDAEPVNVEQVDADPVKEVPVGTEPVDEVSVDANPVEIAPVDAKQVYAVSVTPSRESSASLSSIYSEGSSSSLLSDSTESACGNDLRRRRRDIVILNAEDDNVEACLYKEHLESLAINIPDITVDVFHQIGAGHGELQSLNDVTTLYNYVLVFVTENCIKCKKTRFQNEMVLISKLTNNCEIDCAVVPVWTKDKGTFTEVPMELRAIKGLHYHNFNNDFLGRLYVDAVRNLVNNGRKKN